MHGQISNLKLESVVSMMSAVTTGEAGYKSTAGATRLEQCLSVLPQN